MPNQNNVQTNQRDQNDRAAYAAKSAIDKTAENSKQFADVAEDNINSISNLREKAAENTKQIVQAGIESASDQARAVTERFTRSLGFTGQDGERLAQQSKQNMEAVARCGTVLTQAFQDASRTWIELSQQQFQRNLDGATRLARAKSVQEYSAIQSELVRESMEQIVQSGRAIVEKSLRATDEASKVFSSVENSSSRAR